MLNSKNEKILARMNLWNFETVEQDRILKPFTVTEIIKGSILSKIITFH